MTKKKKALLNSTKNIDDVFEVWLHGLLSMPLQIIYLNHHAKRNTWIYLILLNQPKEKTG
jgi:hypothetical protein